MYCDAQCNETFQLHEQLQHEFLPCERHVRLILLHVGTNDASTTRANKSIDTISDELVDLIERLRLLYSDSEIYFSGQFFKL